jgi:hypothetical protein
MIMAWMIVSALGAPQPFIEKQIRVEPKACHLPAIRGEYPIGDEWHRVTIKIACKR